ncbi:hypothetical protein SARI_02704 [Salmonella enterica subsp. arizonae serovar 62:z4,z23:-]|uniref:Uncharacterized protein n=1 Tax=Salmonella arizonae (strain ATCC BAA-731 / CDC346-86 / RSK2980) TaxID=41514 RepID=A9MNS8_SALAR|nr:hypothetical protein SARI_02704 [Salmonella enterica subsp. arizonae serovar 62:z4,z23:-]
MGNWPVMIGKNNKNLLILFEGILMGSAIYRNIFFCLKKYFINSALLSVSCSLGRYTVRKGERRIYT